MHGRKHKSDQVVHEMEQKRMTPLKPAWLSGNRGVRELAVRHLICLSTESMILGFQEKCGFWLSGLFPTSTFSVGQHTQNQEVWDGPVLEKKTLALTARCLSDVNCL